MKYCFLLIPVLLIAFASSCKKDDPDVSVHDYNDSVSMKLNGQQWPLPFKKSLAVFNNEEKSVFKIIISDSKSDTSYMTQSLIIGDFPLVIATHKIYSNPYTIQLPSGTPFTKATFVAIHETSQPDTFETNTYSIWDNAPAGNELSIDSYNPNTKIIKGRFHFTMYRTDTTNNPTLYGLTDTLRFTEGYFDMKIYNH